METNRNDTPISLDSICTCQTCDHSLANDCINARCTCCSKENHALVLDGIAGFTKNK